ncbi:hypothetical protein [Colwellia piezophila]|uniref:hypothetical protein n=1 Tax=Colwellia piezophila TaxID=211668 RepID=UPI000377B060|nr:hypothetical protein [Colwellia piezophila]
MNKSLTFICLIILPLIITGCAQANNEQLTQQKVAKVGEKQVTEKPDQSWQQVTVKYYDFEGGFYGLVSQKGDKLLPMNLAKEYQLPGTVLRVQGQLIKDMMTIQQWGQPFNIVEVELIKLGKANLGDKF